MADELTLDARVEQMLAACFDEARRSVVFGGEHVAEVSACVDGSAILRTAREEIDRRDVRDELVRFLAPSECLRSLSAHGGDELKIERVGTEAFGVRDVDLNPATTRAPVLVEGGLEGARSKHRTLDGHRGGQRRSVDPRSTEDLERARESSSLRQLGGLEQAAPRIDPRRIQSRHVRRRKNPGQSCLLERLSPLPALGDDDLETVGGREHRA